MSNVDPFDSKMLAAIRPLREAGFALHWLHPRAKKPLNAGWSTAPIASLDSLRSSYRDGYNLGVRLGEYSRVLGGYLHLFDMDIRVADDAPSAWEALREMLPGFDITLLPTVQSGSGGESRHIYFVTDKPFASRKLATSGLKFADATGRHWTWEIDLFGTGKQVVMPPSIHPSGQPYRWIVPFDLDSFDSPSIPSGVIEAAGATEDNGEPWEGDEGPLPDLDDAAVHKWLSRLSDDRWTEYDSWFQIGAALHHQYQGDIKGLEIYEEFSKQKPGYKKGQTRAKWRSFGKRSNRRPITFRAIIGWAGDDSRRSFDLDEFDDLDELDDAAVDTSDDDFDALINSESDDLAAFDLTPEEKAESAKLNWTSLLHINDEGAIKPTLHNIELIVKNDPRLVGLPQLNEFTQETVQRTPPGEKAKRRKNAAKETRQLGGRVWQVKDTLNGELWSDDRDFAIRSILEAPDTQGGYGIQVTDRNLKAAVVLAANENAFHPVREYLESVRWDGNQRVERLFLDYVNAPDDAYHRSVSRLVMIAAVTRIFEPGHKFDFATILEGLQGKRKSTFIQVLGRRWFAELDGDFHDSKQMVELMQGAWIMEIPELTGFGRADVRAIKAFISRQRDRARLAYARRAGEFPRQCIFIGSTNDREYLKDDTGGRRFWPVECRMAEDEEIDTDALERNVDQLWAEAVVLYRAMRAEKPHGTLPLYLVDADARTQAARLQESRRVESPDDVLAGRIAAWLDRPASTGGMDDDKPVTRNETCTAQIWVECLGGDPRAFKATEQGMVNRAMLRVPGWSSDGTQHRFVGYGKQRVFYRGGEAGKLARMGLEDLLDGE